jgi:disulfide bond formation protein DsbB
MPKLGALLIPTLVGALLLGTACAGGGGAPAAAPTKPAAGAAAPAKPAAGQAAAAGNVAQGRTLFQQSCMSCHGPEAKGLPGLGKDMTTSEFIKGQTDAQLLEFIKKGRPVSDPANTTKVDMPPKGGNPALTDAQLNDIIAFMRSLQQ